MAEQTIGTARLTKQFVIPKQPEVFRGLQSVTGLRWLPEQNVLLATAMDRRILCCDLTAEPPPAAAADPDKTDGKETPAQPTLSTTYLPWSHENWALHLDVHPDGERIATAGADRLVKVWQWDREEPLTTLSGHNEWVRSVAWSPDGNLLASTGDDGVVIVWKLENGIPIAKLNCETHSLETLCWSPDGTHLSAAGFAGKVFIWDIPDQKLVATVDTGNFRTIEDEVLNGGFSYPSGIRRIACSPDGKQFVVAGLYALTGIEIPTGAEILKFDHNRNTKVRYFGAAFHPSGESLAYSMDDNLSVWNLADEKVTWQIKADQLGLFDICFSDDGRLLATGGSKGVIGVWELT